MKKFLLIFIGLLIFGIIRGLKSSPFNFKSSKKSNKKPMEAFIIAMAEARKKFSRAICENAERIFRLETAHFTSGQFLGTFSPGMERFATNYPYGWNSLRKNIWDLHPEYKPVGTKSFTENRTGKTKTFIVFPSVEASLFTLCEFLKLHNNNAGRWFALDTNMQADYNKKIYNITPKINNAIA